MNAYTLDDMIACAEREVGMRRRVYPHWVASKKMSQARADEEIAKMQAIANHLRAQRDQNPTELFP